MTKDECKKITLKRLELWGRLCAERGDTPIVLLTIGHNEHAGRIVVQTCECGASNTDLARWVLGAAHQLDPGAVADLVQAVIDGLGLFGKHGDN